MSFNQLTSRNLGAVGVFWAVLGLSPSALALTDQDRWAAHQQATQAQDLKKQGQLAEALTHYEESLKLDPTKLAVLMEAAEVEEQLGKLLEAQGHYNAAKEKANSSGASNTAKRIDEKLAALDKRIPHLTLQLASDAPAGAQVFRDGTQLEASALGTPVVLNPGDHTVVVKAPEHADGNYPIKLAEGDNQTVAVNAGASAAPPPPPKPVAAPPPPPPKAEVEVSSGSPRRGLGVMVGAAGAVGIAVGIPLWYLGWRDGNSIGPTADRQLLTGQICVIGGGVLLATGIVLFATAPSNSTKDAQRRVLPTLSVGQNATVVGAVGTF